MSDSASYADWRERLAEANDPAFWPIEAIDALLSEGSAVFWSDGTAAIVLRVVNYPGGASALETIAAAGDGNALATRFATEIETKARTAGITHLLVAGRFGWLRKLRGFRPYQTVLIKELADG